MIRYNLGLIAEYFVLSYYFITLHKILHHRYKTNVGEIDLIVQKNKQIIFIEVKARKNGLHEDILSLWQRRRITRTAELFISKHIQYTNYDLRFDLAIVEPYRLPTIIKNAW